MPFLSKSLNISISFCNPSNRLFFDGSISRIFLRNGYINYHKERVFSDGSDEIHEETFEDAKKIVEASNSPIPPIRQQREFDRLKDKVLVKIDKKLEREYKCYFHGIGILGSDQIENVEARLYLFQRSSVEQAREAVCLATETILNCINEEEALKPYLNNYPLTAGDVRLAVEFKREAPGLGPTCYTDGSQEKVTLEDGELTYLREEVVHPDDWLMREQYTVVDLREPYATAHEIYERQFASWWKAVKRRFFRL